MVLKKMLVPKKMFFPKKTAGPEKMLVPKQMLVSKKELARNFFLGPDLVCRVKIRLYTDFKLSRYKRSWILMVCNPNDPNDPDGQN